MAAAPAPCRPAVTVRPAVPADVGALEAFVDRCSFDALVRRFHGPPSPRARREVAGWVVPSPTRRSWLAVAPDGAVHGIATVARGRDATTEVAFLVEDGQRRRGVGRALAAAVARAAHDEGVGEVTASIQGDNVAAQRFLRALAPSARSSFVDGEVVATVPIAVPDRSRPVPRHPAAGTDRRAEEAA